MHAQSLVALSADGLPIHYDAQGNGAIALVFVHGWCCDRRCWDRQVDAFAPSYTVVRLDLAGHGTSGQHRTQWTVPAFAQDVMAVVRQLELEQVVLIGHSAGGAVIVEAARYLATAVRGVVGVDAHTWRTVKHIRTPAQVAALLAPFRSNFVEATRTLVRSMFVPTSDPTLVERMVAAMSAAPPHIGIGWLEALWGQDRNLQAGLQEITARKIAINSCYCPTNRVAAQQYGIEVMLMGGVGHFVMLEDAPTFNHLLAEAVQHCLPPSVP
jgi:pimeloyl-ACP methyl ester carboxylesterase